MATRQRSIFASPTAKFLANRTACALRRMSAPVLKDIAWLRKRAPRKMLVLKQDCIRYSRCPLEHEFAVLVCRTTFIIYFNDFN